jgi:hypothetical protein
MKVRSLFICAALIATAAVQAQTPPAPSPEMQAAREAVRKSCEADMKSLCGDKQGREAFMCLRTNSDKVSAGCKDAMAKMPHRDGQQHQ